MSVVVATYNRSNVLRFALESIVGQTFTDWETLVIGDDCTDDTAAVVESFADPRIRYINLPRNTGDQSGPNSVGQRLARGELITFLSQDDLWFPDHLDGLSRCAENTGAQLVVASTLRVGAVRRRADGTLEGAIDLVTRSPEVAVEPHENFVASGLVLSRTLALRVGDWKRATRLRYSSSHDYVYRCWSTGVDIARMGNPTVVVIPSIVSPNSYAERRDAEHTLLAPLVLRGDRELIDSLTSRRSATSAQLTVAETDAIPRHLGPLWARIAPHANGIFNRTHRLSVRLGFAAWEYRAALTGVRKGGLSARLRSQRGLPPG